MSNVVLEVKGMHCDSCKALIKMELEDAGLKDKLVVVELGDHHMGKVVLEGVSEEDLVNATQAINATETYQVIGSNIIKSDHD